jgi:hypothetical protein
MRTIIVSVETGNVGSRCATEMEVEDDATDDEIDEQAREVMFSMISWSWENAPEKRK